MVSFALHSLLLLIGEELPHEPAWEFDECRWCRLRGERWMPDRPCRANPLRRRLDWLITPVSRYWWRSVRIALYKNGACLKEFEGRVLTWRDLVPPDPCSHEHCEDFRRLLAERRAP